jgi:hypothetical protein
MMKRIAVLFFVLTLQGLNAFGQTNTMPPTSRSLPHPELQGAKGAAKPKKAGVPSGGTLSHNADIQPPQLATFRRIKREGLLTPRRANIDFGAALEAIFRPENDELGETGIRDTVVTIFPTGR